MLHDISMTGRELLMRLRLAGWQEVGVRGSHHKLERNGRTLIVPVHGKRDVPTGTLCAILKQAGLDPRSRPC
jgi:predicted RNA binding protein YcfA (HicA-like mRNA interferase family)